MRCFTVAYALFSAIPSFAAYTPSMTAMLLALAFALLATPSPSTSAPSPKPPIATPSPSADVPVDRATPSPLRTLGLIRAQFRSHRPPPPFVTYTIERKQLASNGFPDYADSYIDHVWTRTVDRASLQRRVFRDYARGELEFNRPAFNEPRDPGPPTADVFEPAPVKPHPVEFVPTPEAQASTEIVIGTVRALTENEYDVQERTFEGGDVHLKLLPRRDPERNRIREIFADQKTYELHKVIANDRLYVQGDKNYGVIFTITMGMLKGYPIVTKVHGDVLDGYDGDGVKVDYFFRDIAFPDTLPDWYFDKRQYAQHRAEAPK